MRPRASAASIAGYAGLAVFLALERTHRAGGNARSLAASDADDGTTAEIGRAMALAGVVPGPLGRAPLPRLPAWTATAGAGIEAAGLLVRAWSMRALGDAYSRTLRTGERQRVVSDGPYRLVRHPGYLGTMLTWTGFGLTTRSPAVVAAIIALLGRAYVRRIRAEERLLAKDLPGYRDYMRRTKRLIPFAW